VYKLLEEQRKVCCQIDVVFGSWIVDNCDYKGGNGKANSYAHILLCNNIEEELKEEGAYNLDQEKRWKKDDGKDWEDLVAPLEDAFDQDATDEIPEDVASSELTDDVPDLVKNIYNVNDDDWKHFSTRYFAIATADLPSLEVCLSSWKPPKDTAMLEQSPWISVYL
jgi:hypothetical protein